MILLFNLIRICVKIFVADRQLIFPFDTFMRDEINVSFEVGLILHGTFSFFDL